jgi:hypothetical protein
MERSGAGRVHSGEVVLDIGDGVGALILYTKPELEGQEIEVSMGGDSSRVHTEVLERRINGEPVFAAVYASLAEGHYRIWGFDPKPQSEVDIVGGQVSEVDWR